MTPSARLFVVAVPKKLPECTVPSCAATAVAKFAVAPALICPELDTVPAGRLFATCVELLYTPDNLLVIEL